MSAPVTYFTLPNGLRVVHQQDSTTAMVALTLLYNTGARDESPERTGMAHLIEHLMFGGSANVPVFDAELQMAGGSSNAWTGSDFTCFYEIVPGVNVETAFWVESDRMISPLFTPENLETQKSVVIEEFKQQCLNRPYGDTAHHLLSLAYDCHPYRWPVIGIEPAHIAGVTADDVKSFFQSHYTPSNAVLAVTGNISLERCRELCDKYMATVPDHHVTPRNLPVDPAITAPRYKRVEANVPQRALTIAYRMDPYGTAGYYAADAISDILSNGKSSRFYSSLLKGTDLFTEIDASIMGSEEPGLFLINARLRENSDEAERRAIDAIDTEINKLISDGVSNYELERAANKYESTHTFNNLHYARTGVNLAMALMHGERPEDPVSKYRSLTPGFVSETARMLFNPDARVILSYGGGSEMKTIYE